MLNRLALTAAMLLVTGNAMSQQSEPKLSATHDGRWSVFLVCPDVKDNKGLVKGYDYNFVVTVAAGRLEGQYGETGTPSSVNYMGYVHQDGTLDIKASGNVGSSEFAAGKAAKGSAYTYTLHGKLNQSSGQALRREARPCTATFARQ